MLILYKNITPNYSKTHYYFKDFNKYLTFLTPNKVTEIDNKRYTLENGFIRVAIDDKITDVNYNEITYIVDSHNNVCYHVTNIALRTTYVRYDVSVDLWASYIYKAQLDNINVLKCNRKISNYGIYDTIENTDNILNFNRVPFITDEGLTITEDIYENWYVIFYYSHASLILPLVVGLKQVLDLFSYGRYGSANISNFVGKITKVNLEQKGWNDVKVLSAYLVHKAFITEDKTIQNSLVETSDGKQLVAWRVLQLPHKLTLKFNNKNIMNKTYLGTYCYSLPVRHFVVDEGLETNVFFFVGASKFSAYIIHNSELHDITSSFEIPSTDYGSTIRSTDGISSAIGYLRGVIQLGVGISGGSPLSIAKGISSLSNQAVNDMTKPHNSLISNGDFASSFDFSSTTLFTPFKLFYNESIINERIKARKTGVNFNKYIDALETIFNFDLLGTGEDTDDTYLVCNTDITEIPTNAIDVIENKLRNGIYLQYLS